MRAFAAEGAAVHLAGRTLATLEQVAAPIREKGGTATVAQVDALDEAAVDGRHNRSSTSGDGVEQREPAPQPKVTAMSLARTPLARVLLAIAAAAALTVGLVASSAPPASADRGSVTSVSGGGSGGEDQQTEN